MYNKPLLDEIPPEINKLNLIRFLIPQKGKTYAFYGYSGDFLFEQKF